MTVQVIKTKAETGFVEAFDAAEAWLPGDAFVRALRRAALGRFVSLGLPHRRVEEWKYTDLRNILKEAAPLASPTAAAGRALAEAALAETGANLAPDADWMVLLDGQAAMASGRLAGSGHRLAEALGTPPAWVVAALETALERKSSGVLALNGALMSDGLVLDVPDGAEHAEPVRLVHAQSRAGDSEGPRARSIFTRNLIRVGKGARLTLVEYRLGTAARARHESFVTQILVEDGAEVTHVLVSSTAPEDIELGNVIVELGAEAVYRPFMMSSGSGIARADVAVTFQGEHSTFDLGGLALGEASGHTDLTLVVDHAVPHCTSRELFKCVLDGNARGVFQGKVIVRPGAQKTDGKQMAQALMLSPTAEFDSKPELEIYADDVVCGHGSTSAELDEDLLFYCRSRGIPLKAARALLIESFIGEVIEKVADEGLREELRKRAQDWLAAGHT